MTLLLAGLYNEAIGVQLLQQAERPNVSADTSLEIAAGDTVLQRTILLRTAETKQTAGYAESSIVTDRLPDVLRDDLHDGDKAIGLVLRDHEIPTVRHLEKWGRVPAKHVANKYLNPGASKDHVPFYRSYIIAANIPGNGLDKNVPIMRVAEYFLFKLLPAKGV